MYEYLVFAYDMYYPSGGMNDCIGKFNNLSDINTRKVNLDYQFYVVYDTQLDSKYGFNMNEEMERYEEEHGEIPWDQDDNVRRQLLADFFNLIK